MVFIPIENTIESREAVLKYAEENKKCWRLEKDAPGTIIFVLPLGRGEDIAGMIKRESMKRFYFQYKKLSWKADTFIETVVDRSDNDSLMSFIEALYQEQMRMRGARILDYVCYPKLYGLGIMKQLRMLLPWNRKGIHDYPIHARLEESI